MERPCSWQQSEAIEVVHWFDGMLRVLRKGVPGEDRDAHPLTSFFRRPVQITV